MPKDLVETPFARLVLALERAIVDLQSEERTRRDLAKFLRTEGFDAVPEYDLGEAGRIDFAVRFREIPGWIVGIEVKLARGTTQLDVYRQIERYAARRDVAAIVLTTTIAMTLPPFISGKPARLVPPGRNRLVGGY
ncbi:MAG: hypothetical protein IBJ15_00320 [Alphaproteobacteria bacterium]|nr:hypothetical protein [Alphaproteobacteria bacterium]